MLKGPIAFCRAVGAQFWEEGCMARAGALAYTSLLSLVPLMTLSFTVLKAFPVFAGTSEKIQAFIFSNFVTASTHLIEEHLQQFTTQALQLSATGLFFLLATAVVMIFNMELAFNHIWHVKKHRSGISAFLMYWAVLTLVPIIIGVGIAVVHYLTQLSVVTDTTESLQLNMPLLVLTPYLITWVAFSTLYVTVPNCKVKIRHALSGGVVATFLFEMAKYGFSLYVLHFPTYKTLYGALATVPIFLIWLYVTWLIILSGAVFARQLAEK